MTFGEQSSIWFGWLRTRKRSPLKPGSLATYDSYLKRILPRLGDVEVSTFGNAGLKSFVADLAATGELGPKSIFEIVATVKQIVASAVDAEGNQLFARQWNNDFIDLPVVEKAKQVAPSATKSQIERALRNSSSKYSAFYALLAGTGLRVGEARALRIADDGVHTAWDAANRVVSVRTALWRGVEQAPKTPAAVRQIDLAPTLNNYLMDFHRSRATSSTKQFMFTSDTGGPMHDSTIRKFSLEKLGLPGFHTFRRFRVTYLRELGVPEDIIRYWTGHAGHGITDRYSKLAQNIELRKQWASRAGLGFELPKSKHTGGPTNEAIKQAVNELNETADVPAEQPATL